VQILRDENIGVGIVVTEVERETKAFYSLKSPMEVMFTSTCVLVASNFVWSDSCSCKSVIFLCGLILIFVNQVMLFLQRLLKWRLERC
jgi:ABC-type phosphate transport system permease subunit